MRTKYKPWAIRYLEEHTQNEFFIDEKHNDIDAIAEYVNNNETYLEIGPGKGQFIIEMAKKFPNKKFLVIELNSTISGIALKAIDEAGIDNVKLINANFYNLTKQEKKLSFAGLFLNFSDPRPKKRHKKRRLTHPLFLVEYAKILPLGNVIYFKSDNDDFYAYSKEQFESYGWEILEDLDDYDVLEEFDAPTEFETKFKNSGIKIKRMILRNTKDTLTFVKEEDL